LYGSETSSLTLREEHRLGVFENRVLKWTFEPKKCSADKRCREQQKTHFMPFKFFRQDYFFFREIIKQKSGNVPDSLRDAYISYAVLLTPAVDSWNYARNQIKCAKLQMRFRHGDLNGLLVTSAQLWSPTYKMALSHVASVGLSHGYICYMAYTTRNSVTKVRTELLTMASSKHRSTKKRKRGRVK
jgi:hypothetical protein